MSVKIKKVAIANRGEVAVRILRACQDLGLKTVLLHSEADVATRAYRMCDETICIGPATTAESYLDIEANINGAKAAGADAVHPGFGFLSENSDFARRCSEEGIIFIGPSPESIALLGDKIRAKDLVTQAEVPIIPGYQGDDQTIETLTQKAEQIGFPVIVKAAAGGGGRGMKVIRSKDEAQKQIESAKREGKSAFGSDQVFLEKYLDRAKHIEVQIFADKNGLVHTLYERECTIQRRHQKIIEEALATTLTDSFRESLMSAARKVAEAAEYKGAGTVEFLVQDDQFYFLEMNTRLQVEHPVTEMVLGIDLVQAQIMTAQEKELNWPERFSPRGHAIECRIYAEDPYQMGIPSTGTVHCLKWPEGPGRRFEVGIEAGDEVTSFYDPMIAKAIVWGETRARAVQKMQTVLSDSIVFGVKTNIPFLKAIMDHEEFLSGTMTTHFLEKNFPKALDVKELTEDVLKYVDSLKKKNSAIVISRVNGADFSSETSPWSGEWKTRSFNTSSIENIKGGL